MVSALKFGETASGLWPGSLISINYQRASRRACLATRPVALPLAHRLEQLLRLRLAHVVHLVKGVGFGFGFGLGLGLGFRFGFGLRLGLELVLGFGLGVGLGLGLGSKSCRPPPWPPLRAPAPPPPAA